MYRIDIRAGIKCNDPIDSYSYFFIVNDYYNCILDIDDHNTPSLLRVTRDAGNVHFKATRKNFPNSELLKFHEDAKSGLRKDIIKTLDYLSQSADIGKEEMDSGEFNQLVNSCSFYDPFVEFIDNRRDLEFVIMRNINLDKAFNSVMQNHINAYMQGIPGELMNVSDIEGELKSWLSKRNIKVA